MVAATGLAGLSIATVASAQDPTAAVQSSEERRAVDTAIRDAAVLQTERGARLLGSGSPNDRSAAALTESNIQLTTEDGEERLSLALGFDLQKAVPRPTEPGFYKVTRTRLSLVGSAPVDPDKIKSGLFSGDSLVAGSRVKLSITYLSNELGTGIGAEVFRDAAYEACIRDAVDEWQPTPDQREASAVAIRDYLGHVSKVSENIRLGSQVNAEPEDRTYEVMLRTTGAGAAAGSLSKFVHQQCYPDAVAGQRFQRRPELLAAYGQLEAFRRTFLSNKSRLVFFGADASIGSKDYEYLDRGGFKLASASKTSWEGGIYGGFLSADLTFSLRGRLVYGREVKLPDEATICHAVPGDPKEHCVTGPDGAPTRGKTGLASIETRHVLSIGPDTRIALAPQIAYRFKDKEFGAELPIYLAPDEKGALNGGVKLAYASKEDEFSVGLFIGVPFSIFYQ